MFVINYCYYFLNKIQYCQHKIKQQEKKNISHKCMVETRFLTQITVYIIPHRRTNWTISGNQ